MIHKLAGALPSLLLLVPSVGWGLGLGEIQLHSALNQPLVAEIELLSVKAKDVDDLRITLASPEVFARMGVDRPPMLSELRFEVVKKGKRYAIEVRSQGPVREPFLDFLVEATWRSGRMLREYTLLLDPPDLVEEPPPRIQPARSPAASPQQARRPVAPPTASANTFAKGAPGELVYGPVRADETLWSIAKQLRPDRSVTVPQVMMALLKANPEAFDGNNINRLKEGYVLRVQDPSLLTAMSKAEAAREMHRHSRQWQDYKLQAAVEGKTHPAKGSRGSPNALDLALAAAPEPHQLKLVAASEAKPSEKPGSPSSAESAKQQEAGALGQLRKDLMLAQEASEAQRRDNEELRKRLEELEAQLTSMQRLLSLKDEDLAALQRQLRGQMEGAKAQAPESAAVTAEGQVAAAGAQAKTPVKAADEQKSETKPAPAAEPSKPAVKTEPAAPKTQANQEPELIPEPLAGFLADLLRDPTIVGALSIVGLSLLTLLGLIVRRRRSSGDFQESILVGGTSSMLRASAESEGSEHTSFLSEFEGGAARDVHADEADVDPLTEADVYMAYGRYQQAEELLKDAIAQNPGRKELRVKLLELYHTTKNRSAFEAHAAEAFTLLGGGALWDKVLVMGHELLPENPMFSAAPDRPVEIGRADRVPEDEILDIGLDLDSLGIEPQRGAAGGEGSLDDLDLDLGIDFSDLDAFESSQTKKGAPEPAAKEELLDLDLNLAEPQTPSASGTGEQLPDLDFALDFGENGGESPAVEAAKGSGKKPAELKAEEWDVESLFSEPSEVSVNEPSESEQQEIDAALQPDSEPLGDDWAGFDLDALIEKDLRPEPESPESSLELSPASGEQDSAAEEDAWPLVGTEEVPDERLSTSASETAEPSKSGEKDELMWDFDALINGTEAQEAQPQERGATEPSLEWDFSLDEPEGPVEAESAPAKEPDLDSGLVLDLEGVEAPPALDDDLASLEASLDRDLGAGLGDSELFAGLDEVGTKLDLAKAYIDMGDGESARGILEEVIRDGNADQAQQAEELQAQIA